MSTATPFSRFGAWFPDCVPMTETPTVDGISFFDYVDTSPELAANFAWNLEDFSLDLTGTKGAASLDGTYTIGATESFPYTGTTIARRGAYYDGSTPARQPVLRLCGSGGSIPRQPLGIQYDATARLFRIDFQLGGYIPSSGMVRIFYAFRISVGPVSSNYVGIINPSGTFTGTASGQPVGTPPSTGNMTILGIDFPWEGGGYTFVGGPPAQATWASETATLSATSSAFTY
jgi:hypothetical protein